MLKFHWIKRCELFDLIEKVLGKDYLRFSKTFRLSAIIWDRQLNVVQMRPEKVVASYPDVVHIEVDLLKLATK